LDLARRVGAPRQASPDFRSDADAPGGLRTTEVQQASLAQLTQPVPVQCWQVNLFQGINQDLDLGTLQFLHQTRRSQQGWCLIGDSATPERAASKSPTYAEHENRNNSDRVQPGSLVVCPCRNVLGGLRSILSDRPHTCFHITSAMHPHGPNRPSLDVVAISQAPSPEPTPEFLLPVNVKKVQYTSFEN
jgi:hypothetical protein